MFWESLLDNPNQQLKREVLMLGVGVLLGGLWVLEEALSAQMRHFHLNCIVYLFIHRLTCNKGFSDRSLIEWLLMTFKTPLLLFMLFFFCIYLLGTPFLIRVTLFFYFPNRKHAPLSIAPHLKCPFSLSSFFFHLLQTLYSPLRIWS